MMMSLSSAGFAGPAMAGGPTSVLLVVPGEGRTASLYSGSPDYEQLSRLVGTFTGPDGSSTPPPGAGTEGPSGSTDSSGPGVTLTWLIHDVNVWRVDRVFVSAEGSALISTQENLDGSNLWSKPAVWHSASDSKALATLLNRLGVGPLSSSAKSTDAAVPVAAAPVVAAPQSPAERNGWIWPGGLIWGAGGVLVGAALTLLGQRRLPFSTGVPFQGAGGSSDELADPSGGGTAVEVGVVDADAEPAAAAKPKETLSQ